MPFKNLYHFLIFISSFKQYWCGVFLFVVLVVVCFFSFKYLNNVWGDILFHHLAKIWKDHQLFVLTQLLAYISVTCTPGVIPGGVAHCRVLCTVSLSIRIKLTGQKKMRKTG